MDVMAKFIAGTKQKSHCAQLGSCQTKPLKGQSIYYIGAWTLSLVADFISPKKSTLSALEGTVASQTV